MGKSRQHSASVPLETYMNASEGKTFMNASDGDMKPTPVPAARLFAPATARVEGGGGTGTSGSLRSPSSGPPRSAPSPPRVASLPLQRGSRAAAGTNYLGPLNLERWPYRNNPFVAVRRFAPATARVEGGDGHDPLRSN